MTNKKLIELHMEIMDKKCELFVLSDRVRILTDAMVNTKDEKGIDIFILQGLIKLVLLPYLPVEERK